MSNKKVSKSTSTETKSDRLSPKCGRCYVHKKIVALKGHKRYCQFQNCYCTACFYFLRQQRLSADKIAMKRACDLSREKKLHPDEVMPLDISPLPAPLLFTKYAKLCSAQQPDKCDGAEGCKNGDLRSLLQYTWKEMQNSHTVWYIPTKVWQIFSILVKYVYDLNAGIKYADHLESTKIGIFRVIHEDRMPIVVNQMTCQQAACWYFSPPTVLRTDEGIRSPEYPFHNLPFWPSTSLSMFPTSTSSLSESLLKPSIEPFPERSTKPFTDPSVEPSTELSADPSTDSSTESSTYY
ncbi:PREDICTED: uncharacterized protein LOC105567720 isoform X2 [Vollenhovia emeryi]|uniref:uncharacterized protein LOC105567720 isoform X2 n=1 Tax=Vollenhovia emeryi TaxID=411798 RepID=UPI0005F43489|nr:PREDICTED: uncharacterized protein LOC105567720 isoform X2 [Vollenhovia emeryi]